MPKPRELMLPALRMTANFEPETLDAEKRTVELRWYSGAPVRQFSMFDGPFEISFEMNEKSVRLGRLNDGATLKAGHASPSDLSAIFGVIERAWIENGEGRAIARFSERPEVEPYFQDVKAGIIRNVSMEAQVHAMRETTKKGDELLSYLATDWEPTAVALVATGADPNAHALSLQPPEMFRCSLLTSANRAKESRMSDQIDTTPEVDPKPGVPAPDSAQTEALKARLAVEAALEADKARTKEIKRLQAHYNLDEVWAQRHIKANHSIEQVILDATEMRAKQAPILDPHITLGVDHDSIPWRKEQIALSIAAQGGGREIPETARQYARFGFVDAGLELLRAKRMDTGLDCRRDATRIIELALTTSDYSNLLANVATKMLRPAYEAHQPTYRLLSERIDLPDFKTASVLKVGDFPEPLAVAEAGEIKFGSFSEAKDTYALVTYARIISISLQALANDDVGGFQRVMNGVAVRFADKENALWFASLISASGAGPTLGDSGALFNATAVTTAGGHANLTASGTAIDVASIGVGRASMRKQVSLGTTGLGDGIKLNLVPKYILTSPDKETLARQYTTVVGPSVAPSSLNPWAGTLEPLADANLTSANPWYLFADPMRPGGGVSVYGYMSGQAGPQVQTQEGFNVLGVQMRAVEHFGFAFVDFKGGYRNAGA